MCTLIALNRCISGAPLVVAANRDEFSQRPSEGPALRPIPAGTIVAPRDVRAGGTWLGVNAAGLFAAVTNRRCENPDPQRRSRGHLVMEALGAASAREAAEQAESVEECAYNPFNLFLADARGAYTITYEGSARRLDLGPGVHVIGNVDPTQPPSPKVDRIWRQAEQVATEAPGSVLEGLGRICRSHDGNSDPFRDTCVHAGPYGTQSSVLLWLAERPAYDVFRFADGPPCRTGYEDFTPLLRDLRNGSGYAEEDQRTRKVS